MPEVGIEGRELETPEQPEKEENKSKLHRTFYKYKRDLTEISIASTFNCRKH